jgi:hypothetical protein
MGPGHSQYFGNGLWVESVLIVSRMVSHCTGSVTARIGFSVDLDLHEKTLRRIESRWCKNHVELDLHVFVSIHILFFSVQNEFVVCSKTLSPILHGETVI